MKEPAFLAYIGLSPTYKIIGKKFSRDQAEALTNAFNTRKAVRVIGAPREDIQYLAGLHDREIVEGSLMYHDRPDKNSNARRQVMCLARSKNDGSSEDELWVFVFPSKQYVDRVAELIQAVFDRLQQLDSSDLVPREISVVHFEELERRVTEWTGFLDQARRFIRFGDIVIIGNLDILLPGIKAAGFSVLDGWTHFGLFNTFRALRCVDPSAKKQLLLFGFIECFCGVVLSWMLVQW